MSLLLLSLHFILAYDNLFLKIFHFTACLPHAMNIRCICEYPLSLCIWVFILCVIPSTALIHQDAPVKLYEILACESFNLWCHQQENNGSRGHMIHLSVSVPYDPMDFRAVCRCCNEHKDIELNAWCKKRDEKQTNKKECFWNIAFQEQPKVKCKSLCVLDVNSVCWGLNTSLINSDYW